MISIPAAARSDYRLARAYLCRDPEERRLFERLDASSRHFHLRIDHRDDDHFDPNTNTIAWDPYSALRTTKGGTQSPALGLGHEVAHAVEAPEREDTLTAHRLPRYDNAEERRVIRGSERQAALTLGEAVRCDHRGTTYRVATPVSR
jgi:NleD-like pathogen effector protein (putative zinc metallopeptidase)